MSEADFPQLVKLLGGQPYLTRKALYTLVTERMSWADLTQANLDGANLKLADLTADQLALAASFQGAILPGGEVHE